MTVINPVGALLVGKFERMENKYLSHQDNQIALFEEGLWLRQSQLPSKQDDGEFNEDAGYYVLHAGKINPKTWMLNNVMVLSFNQNDNFVRRIDANTGTLEEGKWVFKDTLVQSERPNQTIFGDDGKTNKQDRYVLPTSLTPKDIEDSFASTATMSFWHLPSYIKTLQQTGFDAANIKVYYQNLMSKPLMFCAMILLAAALTLKQTRLGSSLFLIVLAVVIGFTIFFASSFLQALGASSQIPVFLAAWAAPAICFFAGLGVILTIEDG
jgi:lipopolysaccharide export system permease protein